MRDTGSLPANADRRRLLKGFGSALALAGLGRAAGPTLFAQESCTILADPALTEGPYFVDEILNRSDIRIDPINNSVQKGLPISLLVNVSQRNSNCEIAPLTGAYVDIWHCNAAGIYSDVTAQNTRGQKFLRGYQATDRAGNVGFTTIYPGWYPGRAVHIHAKIRMFTGNDQQYEFTTQFFFDESVTDQVYTLVPYSGRPGRNTFNTNDGIYLGPSSLGDYAANSGESLLLQLTETAKANASSAAEGNSVSRDKGRRHPHATALTAYIPLVLDLSLGSSPDQRGPGGGGPGGPGPGMPPPG